MDEQKSATSFIVAGEYFAVDTESVRAILEYSTPTRVPLTKPFITGVINNHGSIIPVVDFRTLIDKQPDNTLPEQCIMVVAFSDKGKEDLVGFKVDEMHDVFAYSNENFKNEVVVELKNQGVQNALIGTIKQADKFIYLTKLDELGKAIV